MGEEFNLEASGNKGFEHDAKLEVPGPEATRRRFETTQRERSEANFSRLFRCQ